MYREKNCKWVRRTCVQGKYRNKTTKFGDSSLQSEVVEYVWEIKGNGKDNAWIGKCDSLSEGGSWTSLWAHYQDWGVIMVKATKIQKEVQMTQIKM